MTDIKPCDHPKQFLIMGGSYCISCFSGVQIKQNRLTSETGAAYDLRLRKQIDQYGSKEDMQKHIKDQVANFVDAQNETYITTQYTEDTKVFETIMLNSHYSPFPFSVEEYKSRAEALEGHNRWVQLITSDKPPEELEDLHRGVRLKRRG